jgi:hypothetical protein
LDGKLLRDGGSADERSQKKREKKPFHGHTPRWVERRSVTLAHSRQHLSLESKPFTAKDTTVLKKGIKKSG